ncbi:MAG: hypothetical protein MK009_07800 [Gammaproteobacteria bacterium]|nr:hypothetical protein [Gammaproteobacteria bacterium]
MSLRLALFGQAPLAIVCLDRLQEEGHDVRVVYAPEDGSRPDVLAAHARNLGISVVQRDFSNVKMVPLFLTHSMTIKLMRLT